MTVDDQMVARVARLARLRLEPDEAAPLAQELNHILGWIDQLQAVDTADVQPMSAVMACRRDWRADEVTEGGIADQLLANAPKAAHGFFAVPKVIE
jgi:aspartyl-tRNA(Asn)/glutamyl-tRNA(Gln) amidotransferase subunit C